MESWLKQGKGSKANRVKSAPSTAWLGRSSKARTPTWNKPSKKNLWYDPFKSKMTIKKGLVSSWFSDYDRDGVPNVFDCQPMNPKRQDSKMLRDEISMQRFGKSFKEVKKMSKGLYKTAKKEFLDRVEKTYPTYSKERIKKGFERFVFTSPVDIVKHFSKNPELKANNVQFNYLSPQKAYDKKMLPSVLGLTSHVQLKAKKPIHKLRVRSLIDLAPFRLKTQKEDINIGETIEHELKHVEQERKGISGKRTVNMHYKEWAVQPKEVEAEQAYSKRKTQRKEWAKPTPETLQATMSQNVPTPEEWELQKMIDDPNYQALGERPVGPRKNYQGPMPTTWKPWWIGQPVQVTPKNEPIQDREVHEYNEEEAWKTQQAATLINAAPQQTPEELELQKMVDNPEQYQIPGQETVEAYEPEGTYSEGAPEEPLPQELESTVGPEDEMELPNEEQEPQYEQREGVPKGYYRQVEEETTPTAPYKPTKEEEELRRMIEEDANG